ncbi:MAG: Piwi domain-containing protein [Candidatus Bathyarchaeia archaeon]
MSFNFSLYASLLERPLLRFNYTLQTAVSKSTYTGISRYGPYDKDIFPKNEINLAAIYPISVETHLQKFIRAFGEGIGVYPGFRTWFRVNIKKFDKFGVEPNTDSYKEVLNKVAREDYDIVYVIIDGAVHRNSLYPLIKTTLLGNGVPCQVIRSERISTPNDQLQWILANIALSSYAKMGGTPWVISAKDKPEIVLGMSRAMDKTKKVIVGFTTLFKHNGDFILSYSKSPVTTWDEYEKGIENLVCEAIKEYQKREEVPTSLVFHFHKRTGKKEIQAVKNAIESLNVDIKYALLHLNSYSSYRIFDTSDFTYVPFSGLMVRLSSRQALLVTDGRQQYFKRPYIGTPTVLEITLDKESTIDFKEFPRLVEQVYDFSYVNWRGFNARTIPVTINYSYLIARLVSNLEYIEQWNSIITNGKLIDKAWFL